MKRKKLKKEKRRKQGKGFLLTALLFILIVSSGTYLGVLLGVYARPYMVDFGSGLTPPATLVASDASDAPPQTLIIPKLGIDARVESVGVNATGNMKAPSTFHTVAWFDGGAKPGEAGTAVIVGHLDNALGLKGVFYQLDQLGVGDSIVVRDAAGRDHAYTVSRVARYPYDQAPLQEIFQGNGTSTSELHLITCSGSWLEAAKTYDQRLVVYAIADPHALAANY